MKSVVSTQLTCHNGALLILSVLILSLARVCAEMSGFDAGDGQGVPVAAVVDDVAGGLQEVAVLVPRDLGLGRGVDEADHLRFVALRRVDVGFLVFNLGSI